MGKMAHIGKNNRANSDGSVFPNGTEVALRLVSIIQTIKDNTGKLLSQKNSNNSKLVAAKSICEQVVLLILLWINNKLDILKTDNRIEFLRPSTKNLATFEDLNNVTYFLRVIDKDKPHWVEITMPVTIKEKYAVIWRPIPKVFSSFIWRFIRSKKSYDYSLFRKSTFIYLAQNYNKAFDTNNLDLNHTIANRSRFESFFIKCVNVDESISKLGKSALKERKPQIHNAADFYPQNNTHRIRKSIYDATNRYFALITDALQNFNLFHQIKIDITDTERQQQLLNPLNNEADYLVDKINVIFDFDANGEQIKPIVFGASFVPTLNGTKEFLNLLRQELEYLTPSKHASRKERIAYHNQLVKTLALHLIIFTGVRPTHGIGPYKGALDSIKFTIRDKGKARHILLPDVISEDFESFEIYLKKLSILFPCITDATHLLFLINDFGEVTQLSAKILRKFTHELNSDYLPYFFRRGFAQRLEDIKCSSAVFNILMGHSNYGEQFGLSTTLSNSLKKQKDTINTIATLLSAQRVVIND